LDDLKKNISKSRPIKIHNLYYKAMALLYV